MDMNELTISGVTGHTGRMAATGAGRWVLQGEAKPGLPTPAGLFGRGLPETIAGTTIAETAGASHA